MDVLYLSIQYLKEFTLIWLLLFFLVLRVSL